MKKSLLLFGTCFCLLLTSCSPVNELTKTVEEAANTLQEAVITPEPTVAPTLAPKETKLKLGKKGKTDNWTICVKKAQIKSKIKNGTYRVFKTEKGDRFVVLTATIRNNGKKKATFLPRVGYEDEMLTATLYYKGEYEYQPLELLSYDKDLVESEVKPLSSSTGIIVFEVPKKVAKAKGKLTVKIGTKQESLVYSLK